MITFEQKFGGAIYCADYAKKFLWDVESHLLTLPWETKRTARHELFLSDSRLSYSYGGKAACPACGGTGRMEHEEMRPRCIACVGKGTTRPAYHTKPLTDPLRIILNDLNEATGSDFNAIFLNKYDDEKQHLGWHALYKKTLLVPSYLLPYRMVSSTFIIYGLTDPRTGKVRYVGKSTIGMRRPAEHVRRGRSSARCKNWVQSLLSKGLTYNVCVLEEVTSAEDLDTAERKWIAHGRKVGWELTNMTDGGEGASGLIKSPELRARMSRQASERQASPEVRERARQKALGHAVTSATRAKLRKALLGRTLPKEHCENIRKSLKGRIISSEHRKKLSAAAFRRYAKHSSTV